MKTYTPEEQKDNRKLWVGALRSGKYVQGEGYLCRNGKPNVFGVLCDVAKIKKELALGFVFYGHEKINDLAPKEAVNFVGLKSRFGLFGNTSLVKLNDGGTHFSEIADIIESEPEGLFTS